MAVDKASWARVAAGRATGVAPDPEDVAAVQETARPPRTEFERRILERLGYDEDETPPAA